MYKIKPVMQVNVISHIPILPQNLCLLLNNPGFGFLPNLIKEAMMRIIQIKEVVIDKNV